MPRQNGQMLGKYYMHMQLVLVWCSYILDKWSQIKLFQDVDEQKLLKAIYKFYCIKQEPNQSILDFVAVIKTRAYKCEFCETYEQRVLDQFIIGIVNLEY